LLGCTLHRTSYAILGLPSGGLIRLRLVPKHADLRFFAAQSHRMLQPRLIRRIAALKLSWKLADDHCPAKSECTTAETVFPTKTNSTLGSWLRDGSLYQDLSNSALSTGLLSSAMNLCMKKTSLLRRDLKVRLGERSFCRSGVIQA
jgi:hypothetical protein